MSRETDEARDRRKYLYPHDLQLIVHRSYAEGERWFERWKRGEVSAFDGPAERPANTKPSEESKKLAKKF